MYPYGVFLVLALLALATMFYPVRQHRSFCVIVSCIFLVASFALYGWVGSPGIIPALEVRDAKITEAHQTILVESENIKKHGKDLESWIRLGQAYTETENWPEAAAAFKQAVVLSGGQPDLIMAYARSLIMDTGGTVGDHAKESLRMVLLQKPDHPEARYYMAVRTLQDGKTKEAMQQMKSLYRSLPDDSPVKAMIDTQIGRN